MIYSAAKPDDYPDIEALLAQTEMPGWISLSYRADLAARTGHPDAVNHTAIARDEGVLVATARCVTMPSRQGPITWIGGLRIAPSHRKKAGLMRNGLAAIREHLLGDPPDWQLAAVLSDNLPAQALLSRRSDAFPKFSRVTDYTTFAMRAGGGEVAGVRTAQAADAGAITARLAAENRPLAPVFDPEERLEDWQDLAVTDFMFAQDKGGLAGVAALWDQRASRRFVVTDYARPMRMMRPFWNLAGPMTGQPALPPIGATLNAAFLSFLNADTPDIALNLIEAGLAMARRRGIDIVNLGLAVDDPLHDIVARTFRHQPYRSTIYGVTWPGGRQLPPPAFFAQSKVELALL